MLTYLILCIRLRNNGSGEKLPFIHKSQKKMCLSARDPDLSGIDSLFDDGICIDYHTGFWWIMDTVDLR
jgi:hypothetical protein